MNASNNGEVAIELAGLTKKFGSTLAVDNLSLSVKRGSTFGLIGPNGAGKSTTIKMLMGLLSPTAGSVHVLGRDVSEEPVDVKQLVGYVPEQHFMDRWMRVSEVIGYCRSAFVNWNDETCRDLLDRFELDGTKKVKTVVQRDAGQAFACVGGRSRSGNVGTGRTDGRSGSGRSRRVS